MDFKNNILTVHTNLGETGLYITDIANPWVLGAALFL
jgi:hypothetical protein